MRIPELIGHLVGVVLLSCVASASSAAEVPDDLGPNVLLITIDTLRPDALGWIGGRNDTPAIDRLAANGFRFPRAVSPVPLTLPAHTTIMTGLVPPRHGVRDNGQTVASDMRTLAEILRDEGYSTAAFVSGFPLDRIFGLDRGFDHYDDHLPSGREGWLERIAGETTDAAVEWVGTATRPWFVWVHYYDPHDPYEPPREFWGPGSQGAYLGEVRYTDYAVERLLSGVARSGGRSTLTVLTADHGEALGDHREKRHGYFVYDATMTVPLVFHFQGRIGSGASEKPARLVDIAPTILDLVGAAATFHDIDGVSLVPTLRGERQEIPPSYIETYLPWIFFGWSPLRGVRTAAWKLIDAPKPELYHLTTDPEEQRNILESEPQKAAELRSWLDGIDAGQAIRSTVVDDSEALERLRALGYVGVGEAQGSIPDGLADPKDRIELRDQLQQAEGLIEAGRFGDAVREFDAVLRAEPDNRCAVLRSGIALLKAGRPDEAIPRLTRATELDPDRAEAQFALADALMRVGDGAGAASHWRQVTRLQPRRSQAWFNLGVAEAAAGDGDAAVKGFTEAAELDPDNITYLRELALAQYRAGLNQQAVRSLARLEAMTGADFREAAVFGLVLLRADRIDEALEWLRRADPTEDRFVEARLALARFELAAGRTEEARIAVDDAAAVQPDLARQLAADPELSVLLEAASSTHQ